VVPVHGSTGPQESWLPHLPHLREVSSLASINRRGRGERGDASDSYALERETEDVEAVIEATDASNLFGHPSMCSAPKLATRDVVDLEEIVVFEPAILVGEYRACNAADRMADLLDDGDREGAMRLAFCVMTGIDEVEAMPHWPEMIELASVTHREFEAVESTSSPRRWTSIRRSSFSRASTVPIFPQTPPVRFTIDFRRVVSSRAWATPASRVQHERWRPSSIF